MLESFLRYLNLYRRKYKYKKISYSLNAVDLNMKYLEFKNNDLQRIVNSDLYKHLLNNNYHFVNWLHGDLIFVHRDFRD